MKNKAIFLDRDGVINVDRGYVSKIKHFEFIPASIEALKSLSSTDYKLIIITNQSGIGRGYYSIRDFNKLNKYMFKEFKQNKIKIDKIYFCLHTPEENCKCRKPNIKLINSAKKEFSLDLKESYVVGDKASDIRAGKNAGCKTILVRTGQNNVDKVHNVKPDFIANNLLDAIKKIK